MGPNFKGHQFVNGAVLYVIRLIFIFLNQTKTIVRKVLLSCVVFACLLCLRAGAQTPLGLPYNLQQSTTTSLPNTTEYHLEVDTTHFDIGELIDSDLTGFNTYRIYVSTSDPQDQVSAVYGNINEPTELVSSGQIFQSTPLGEVTSDGIIPAIWSSFPSNEFDSFITIGIDEPANGANGEGDINIIESTANPWTEGFEPESGEFGTGIVMNDITGGSWFVLPNFNNGTAGENLRVLVAQITTNGTLSGNLHIQLFLNGDNINGTVYLNLPMPICGCLDSNACNWNPDATDPSGQCTYPEEGLDCDGFCLFDADGDEICDDDELPGCTYLSACNFDPAASDEDGSCIFATPGNDCEGNCLVDLDSDGICDQSDPCIGALDACGICNGDGPLLDCGCTELPSGDCDCDGNQLDALGVCGGLCTEDADQDGVCDNVEVPGCTAPSACNFSAEATEENGSCTFPEPAYDCNNNCLQDTDEDGICDPFEVLGCDNPQACNYDPAATDHDGSCLIPGNCSTCDGTELVTFDDDDDGICDADEVLGCTDPEAPNYDLDATNDDGTCKVFGCTDLSASNYDPTATDENGTCVHTCTGIAGCAYPDAENYSPEADCDNGTCTFDCGSPDNCMFDQDGNGVIGSYDLIYFLTLVGLPCAP